MGIFSGKEKAHKHKQIFPVTARAGGGVSRPGGGGSPDRWPGVKSFMCCVRKPKEHKRFRPGTRPGGIGFPAGRIGDRGAREIVYVPNVYAPFPAPTYDLSLLFEEQNFEKMLLRLEFLVAPSTG